MLDQRAPVVVDIPLHADSVAVVGCFVPIVLNHVFVGCRRDNRIGEAAEVRPVSNGVTIDDGA